MSLFSKSDSYLGVDLGTASVKLVELKNESGRPRLLTYAYAEEPTGILKSNPEEARDRIVALLKKTCKEAGIISRRVTTALPSFLVFSSVVNLPEMPKEELELAVKEEAKKYMPSVLEDMVLDWQILEDGNASGQGGPAGESFALPEEGKKKPRENLRILMTAATKELIKRYTEIFKLAGLELIALETEAFALSRSLVGRDPSTVMVLDIGASNTDIIVVEKGVPIINRGIDIGGGSITKSIEELLNIDAKKAEQIKRDLGANIQEGEVPPAVREVLDFIISEIRYTFEIYQAQSSRSVEKVILTGGSVFLPNIIQYFSENLKMRVYAGDPWARVIYPPESRPLLDDIGPRFAVALGLAMREIMK